MITCRELAELLIDFLSGELPPEHRARLEQHLRDCPPCEIFLKTYQLTIQMTRQLPCQPLPAQLVERLRAAVLEIRTKPSPDSNPSCGDR